MPPAPCSVLRIREESVRTGESRETYLANWSTGRMGTALVASKRAQYVGLNVGPKKQAPIKTLIFKRLRY